MTEQETTNTSVAYRGKQLVKVSPKFNFIGAILLLVISIVLFVLSRNHSPYSISLLIYIISFSIYLVFCLIKVLKGDIQRILCQTLWDVSASDEFDIAFISPENHIIDNYKFVNAYIKDIYWCGQIEAFLIIYAAPDSPTMPIVIFAPTRKSQVIRDTLRKKYNRYTIDTNPSRIDKILAEL